MKCSLLRKDQEEKVMNLFKDILRGVVIGIANAIPGVSGGTMMVSMGIYDKLIYSVTHLFQQPVKSIKTLLPYFVGMAIGIVGLAFAIVAMFEHIPFQTCMLFIGLILGGVPILTGHLKGTKLGVSHGLVFLVLFGSIILLQIFGGHGADVALTLTPVSLIKLVVVGVIAANIIPGVSGSMMLMTMGYYYPVIGSVKNLITALVAFDIPQVIHICLVLIPFGIGVIVGIFAVAKLIEMLMEKYEALTYSGIMGLVVASPVVILMSVSLAGMTVLDGVTGVITFIIGIVIALCLGKE
jgi:putative membrane protein